MGDTCGAVAQTPEATGVFLQPLVVQLQSHDHRGRCSKQTRLLSFSPKSGTVGFKFKGFIWVSKKRKGPDLVIDPIFMNNL